MVVRDVPVVCISTKLEDIVFTAVVEDVASIPSTQDAEGSLIDVADDLFLYFFKK